MGNKIVKQNNKFYTKVWGKTVELKTLDAAVFWYYFDSLMSEIEKEKVNVI